MNNPIAGSFVHGLGAGRASDDLVARLRLGLWIVIFASAMFALMDLLRGPAHSAPVLLLRFAQAAVAAASLILLRSEQPPQRATGITVLAFGVFCFATAAAGILTGDTTTTRGVCVLLALGTATGLPWGVVPQFGVAVAGGAAVLWSTYHTLGSLALLLHYPGVTIGLGASVYIAYGFTRLHEAERRAVAALRESEGSLHDIIANIQDVVFRNDVNGVIRFVSPSVQQLGYAVEDLIGQDAGALYCEPGDQERIRAALLEHHSVTDVEVTIKRKDGTPVTVAVSSHLLLNHAGAPVGFEGVLRDITARKHAEAALRASEERFKALVENASDAICVVDANAIIQYASPAMERITGFLPSDLVGAAATQFVHPDDLAALYAGFAAVAPTAPYRAECRMRHADGSWVDIELTGRVWLDAPLIRGTVLNVRDVSDRKQLEQQRSDFVAMLAHDIRNPLAIISGYTEMLLNSEGLSADARQMLFACEQSSQALLSLVTNYLQHAQIEADQLMLSKQPLLLNDLLGRVSQQYRSECVRRHITLDVKLRELPPLNADRVALERVFTNLLQNAVKFTPDGGRVTLETGQEGASFFVSIADTGPGIPTDELAGLFLRYRQTPHGRSRGGTGLGLFIVKALVEAHGGSVDVASTLGVGSRFVVHLPAGLLP